MCETKQKEVYISNTGYHNASNVGYPTLRTKPKAEMKTDFKFYIHFYRLAWFQCFFILVAFLYMEVFNREKNKKETILFKDFLECVETEILIKTTVCITMI